ncbi:uncharacterized protein PHALS_08331 [Plasmopara halstedii]|uniref:Uncharacterized protein n=1 Tax=Plasmopara halstedii TaxID=4781 RepID=A0A0P1ACH8_PLAHL|nr:uncharacterized protein PHALS_08331 [Plasmopara halstedii]CEG38246.1 hypothetical protein PHALS_08331 [Plasmopara halstedii]|eukprot:XP_024574615.1 hypothetical protein PHALS_08331 [Plasmopara halstedii]
MPNNVNSVYVPITNNQKFCLRELRHTDNDLCNPRDMSTSTDTPYVLAFGIYSR